LDDGPGGEVIQGSGVALKRAVPIRLGGVPGMPGFRGQTKIGQFQGFHHFNFLTEKREVTGSLEMGVQENQTQNQGAPQDEDEENGRFSQSSKIPFLVLGFSF